MINYQEYIITEVFLYKEDGNVENTCFIVNKLNKEIPLGADYNIFSILNYSKTMAKKLSNKIHFLYLPPYCSELNTIEHLQIYINFNYIMGLTNKVLGFRFLQKNSSIHHLDIYQ